MTTKTAVTWLDDLDRGYKRGWVRFYSEYDYRIAVIPLFGKRNKIVWGWKVEQKGSDDMWKPCVLDLREDGFPSGWYENEYAIRIKGYGVVHSSFMAYYSANAFVGILEAQERADELEEIEQLNGVIYVDGSDDQK